MMIDGLPRIDRTRCTSCGKCKEACPRDLIAIEKYAPGDFLFVACSNSDKGPDTRKACQVGCIACGICQKLTQGIFTVENNLARINHEKIASIKNSDEVILKCPAKCIMRIQSTPQKSPGP